MFLNTIRREILATVVFQQRNVLIILLRTSQNNGECNFNVDQNDPEFYKKHGRIYPIAYNEIKAVQ